jgi:hypothetical protein
LAAQKHLSSIDLVGNQLIAAVLENLAADPGTLLNDGRVWYRTDTDVLRLRANGAFRTIYDESFSLDEITIAAADVNLNSNKIINLASPATGTDAANKNYVDTVFTGLDWKASVRAASTANVAIATELEDGDTLDGVTLATGDRVLLKNQTAPEENGIYVVVASGAAGRSTDADANAEVTSGLAVAVSEGTANLDTVWFLTTNDPIVVGTTGLTFTQFPAAASLTAGNGLDLTGNTLSVNVDNSSIEINADTLRVKALGITNAMLAGSIDLTTKVTGVLPIANGGTNANTAAGAKTSLGFMTRFAADITGDGADVDFVVNHALNTTDIVVSVYEATTNAMVFVDVVRTDANNVTINFAVAPANGKVYRVVVIG